MRPAADRWIIIDVSVSVVPLLRMSVHMNKYIKHSLSFISLSYNIG